MTELFVLINGELVGVARQTKGGEFAFSYDRTWQEGQRVHPLSLSMPLARREYGDSIVRPFLEGLLPEDRTILENWARRFHVSPRNPFALLTHMGEDCAGAVQFVRPLRYRELSESRTGVPTVEWLTDEGIAERLQDLVDRHGTGRLPGDRGQFSLAGAQPKMPLFSDGSRWGIPSGATPSTHILKPPAQPELDGFDVNEHLCLELAAALGLNVIGSTLKTFANMQALVVERFDRLRTADGRVTRLHQEDVCQALAIAPLRKYESDGGPGAPEVVSLLIAEADDPGTDVGAFLDALALNWVIGGTDAHAKNYSLLLAPGSVKLAPLYDLISVLPYPRRIHYRQARLAMKVDREYRVWRVQRRHWEGLAMRCELDSEPVLARVKELVEAVPAAVALAAAGVRQHGVQHDVVERLEAAIAEHSERCLAALDA